MMQQISNVFTTSSTIGDVLKTPCFNGFAQYLLPLEWGYDEKMPLSRVSSLLPYHSHIDANRSVEILNYMYTLAQSGQKIFYKLNRKDAGLFFFKGKPGSPFAVFCPGGAFSYVGSIHEGFPFGIELSKKGYNAFVIQYRTGSAQGACMDLAEGISYIFHQKDQLQVDTNGYSVWGFSAGARMAAYLGTYGPSGFGGDDLPRPSTVVMGYTGHSEYSRNDPPTYVAVGAHDGIANPRVMERRVEKLKSMGIPAEFHMFPSLGHGFGLGIGTTAEGWVDDAIRFWEEHRVKH
ncbi:alpha/beta hydrolase [Histomonas meleagridis]|uniref:alpha/beta hydrolase n=1 Tax=Histomonas meleagridis TaxID=135588 RepID=UPI00355A6F4B|nr:alpha/beta hydrolase [Histomonas meleagridis]KAH0802591.1 alpha/beta hydrolase [Histomonas meleagridis]